MSKNRFVLNLYFVEEHQEYFTVSYVKVKKPTEQVTH
jgi:hypothetical protein